MVLGANIFPIKTKEVTSLFEGNDKRGSFIFFFMKNNIRNDIEFRYVLNVLGVSKKQNKMNSFKWIILNNSNNHMI